ncbi:efflux RND transporter permease subunit [Fimbriiglobus ruber]|uniref:RND efflux system, inner membrane transporter CmeB n=1 Tax=Fimbriiglobus ruber TaxID=1908690 RepID=A0A225DE05_9BACT|nr:efflux RND transporter permease subunit [Fimbriiglobus ruber]OWK35576.1 RND efflux system, inner membrane transporter CmeB [Fimbriiglobus ruber]
MISRFFIDRPIFASVLSIIITLAGAVAVFNLPIAQYPDVTPPTVIVTAIYPGANSLTVQDTVAAPIEEQVSGVEGMMYMSSQCTNDGTYTLTVTFKLGTDSDMAQVLVQNRVSLALPVIPALVQREGIMVKKQSPNTLMIVNLIATDQGHPDTYLSNYATIQIKDELGRLPGVAGISYYGQRDYSMRAWLNPNKLASLNLTASDVVNAITQQNIQVAAGQIGQQPAPKGQQFQLTINTQGRLIDPAEFADIIIKVGQGGSAGANAAQASMQTSTGGQSSTSDSSSQAGTASSPVGQAASIVRLRDVARVELGAQQYDQTATLDGKPSVAMSIYGLPGANALDTAKGVYAKMEDMKKRFPEGIDYKIVYDTTPFVRQSVDEVFNTLRDATILVALVVLLFLQNWRAAIIPLIAVPVAIVGTFAAMAALGFSLNNLSLFGLVLAIGIVVDDAIVVVENVERWLEKGEEPKEAARKAMDEVTGPVIAIALVLSAVFVPCAFISGITGQFFRQFAITIAVSTLISAFNSLTLSPALAALLLKKKGEGRDPVTRLLDGALGWFFRLFNKGFGAVTEGYARVVQIFLRISLIVLLVYAGLLAMTYWEFTTTPTGFVPQQDKGYLLLNVQLPDSASVERTQGLMARIEKIALETDGVANTVAISGQSLILNANTPNLGSVYVVLKPFAQRGGKLSADAIAAALETKCRQDVRGATVTVFGAPPIEGLGTTGGFKLVVEDRGNTGIGELQRVTDQIVADGNGTLGLQRLFSSTRADTPWLYLAIDRTKCDVLGVPVSEVFNALQYNLGSYYVNNFNEFGRNWQVNVQADPKFRDRVRDIRQLQVRNNQGRMFPLGTVLSVRDTSGPVMVLRYNMYSASTVTGTTAPGTSSGQAVDLMQGIAGRSLSQSMAVEWTELTFLQNQAGDTALYAFALAVVFVFLVLAAQYESWKLPLAVILVVPLCLLCAVIGVNLAGTEVTIFTQIGFIVLVGLASKNAILIVEFAKQRQEAGVERREAAVEASRLRLRPILMTSLAFILGVVPLVIATGAGAEMRQSLGTAVFAGMIGVTGFGLLLTPVFFSVIQSFGSPPVPVGEQHKDENGGAVKEDKPSGNTQAQPQAQDGKAGEDGKPKDAAHSDGASKPREEDPSGNKQSAPG